MNFLTLSKWRTWEPNPIVVKELRQAVRSWAVTGVLLAFLCILFLVVVSHLLGQTIQSNANQPLGRDIFQFLLPILSVVSFSFIPLYVGGRLMAERQEGNVDMLYITTLSAARIIRGKLLCGVYLTVLFFSVCAPFMVFTNLLRGIDLPTVFMLLVVAFLVSILSLQAAIFLSCLSTSRGLKLLVGFSGGGVMMTLVGLMANFSYDLLREGAGSRLGAWNFWGPTLSLFFFGLLLFGFFHLGAIALISSPSANRALPLRSYVTGTWLVTLAVSLVWAVNESHTGPVVAWAAFTTGLLVLALLIAIAEGDDQSVRIRRTIPESGPKRALAFLFYSGTAGGLAWTVLLAATTIGATWVLTQSSVLDSMSPWLGGGRIRRASIKELSTIYLSATLLYVFAYSLFGLVIHRRFLAHRSPIVAAMIALALAALWAIVPNLVLLLFNKLSWDALQDRQLGNVFNVFGMTNQSSIPDHLIFALLLATLGVVLNLKWFFAQRRAFQPLPSEAQTVTPRPQS